MKNIHFILLIPFCLMLSSCKTTGLNIGGLDVGNLVNQGLNVFNANNIDDEQELQFGKNMSAILLGARPIYDNKAINTYVNQVGMWLASNSEKPDLPWHFGVINSSSINAFAAPGGYVFITSAMLKQLNNEGTTIVYTSHHMLEAEEFCTDVAIIDNGSIIARGHPTELIKSVKTALNLEDVYLNLTGGELRDYV